jgi:hypothetical protein
LLCPYYLKSRLLQYPYIEGKYRDKYSFGDSFLARIGALKLYSLVKEALWV